MASLVYTATDEYGNDITVRLPDWTGQPLLATTATPPDGTLVADGSEVSRASYPELFAKIGTQYGEGDGVTTFALPDWRDEFPRFSGSTRVVGTKQGDAIRNMTGYINAVYSQSQSANPPKGQGVLSWGPENNLCTPKETTPEGSISCWDIYFRASNQVPTADENRPRNVAFLPCIIYV